MTTAVPAAVGLPSAAAQGAPAPGQGPGSFGTPFVEPTVGPGAGYPRKETGNDPNRIEEQRCTTREGSRGGNQGKGAPDLPLTPEGQLNPGAPAQQPGGTPQQGIQGNDRFIDCKPAAGAMNLLPNGKTLYWDNLAGTENVEFSIASEYGVTGLNDQSRVLDTKARRWVEPAPVDGGARSNRQIEPIVPFASNEDNNDASLFCADHNYFFDGSLMATGGTFYRNEPGSDQSKYGATELNGAENTRMFDPKTNRWIQLDSMAKGRWYPTAVTLDDGRQFVVSGLRKLVRPFNRTALQEALTSGDPLGAEGSPTQNATGLYVQEGQNERVTETFGPRKRGADPLRTSPRDWRWTQNGNSGRRSLPLFSRIHLLPNGNVFYNAGGQSFSPEGQAFDEATWNIAASYDPETRRWKDLGIPGLESATSRRAKKAQAPDVSPGNTGFRGSTFSVQLPLRPDAEGRYRSASFLVGGGNVNPPSPGSYFTIRDSRITTVRTGGRGTETEKMSTRNTGPMIPGPTGPQFGRWYGSGTLLPTGEVLATGGADRDEVLTPGFETPQRQAEIFNPKTNTWRPVASQTRARTYHNTANLQPDATVLIGGHAVISNSYLRNQTIPGGRTSPNGTGRDPSFEIYRPPYLDCGKQGRVTKVRPVGNRLEVTTDGPARNIASVVLVRNTTTTHIVDADQKSVELKVLSRRGNKLTLAQAPNGAVLPPGPYMVFANKRAGNCLIPSVSRQVTVARKGKVAARSAQRRRQPRFTG